MVGLEIAAALPEERSVLANLMQLYTHDFSEHWVGTSRGDLQADGRFPEYPLDPYWRDPGRIPLLFRQHGHLAGFALLNDVAHSGLAVERNMAELFILRKYRHSGIGIGAVHVIFDRYPGQWETAVARANAGALAFWRKAITHHPSANSVEETDIETAAWNGPIIRFRIHPRLALP